MAYARKKKPDTESSVPLLQKKIAFLAIAKERSRKFGQPTLQGALNRADILLRDFRGKGRIKKDEPRYIATLVRENWEKTAPKPQP